MKVSVTAITCVILYALSMAAAGLTMGEMDAIESFLEGIEEVGKTTNGPTREEVVHDLAKGLGLRTSAGMLYKYSPDAKAAYSSIYDTLVYLSVSGFSTPAQKRELAKVTKYFEHNLLN
ncbi:hypothetical protein LPJ53_005653 [Coemansia erecta]|uniref:Uncharacterized protein n=1 Tax=Coemansia erecta TaxID=147472 RepID=A0A9W7XV91_9FUNG|nr:hypothetical protein LPJ53_005653 [Coemansia erecta]